MAHPPVSAEQRPPIGIVEERVPAPVSPTGDGAGAPAASAPDRAAAQVAESVETPPTEPLPSDAPAAQGPAVTPEEVPAPGQQDTVPPVAADPALQEKAQEPEAEGAAAEETAGAPARRTRRPAAESTELEAST
jgi:hypothetical protein